MNPSRTAGDDGRPGTVLDHLGPPPPAHLGRVSLLALQLCALAGQVLAVHLARSGGWDPSWVDLLSVASMGLVYGSAVWALTRPYLTRLTRNVAVACLAVTPALMVRATNPLLFTGFDEQLHMRTLADIIASHRLFEANPVLEISPRYPGLEVTTVVLHQLGLPVMAAATVLILVARLVLVFVLCDAIEHLTASSRAGGLAVAVYALSPQFVWFNSQFSYQTLSLPLALGAVSLIGRARHAERPAPLLEGATVCLLGVAVTHHLTGFLTICFMFVWVLAERGEARIRVAYGLMAGIASAITWAIVQRSTLEQYFGPMINDLASQVGGGVRRQAFKDSAGVATPLLDKILLLNYAVMLSLIALALFVLTVRWWRRREHDLHFWNPQLLVLVMSLAIPVLLAARVVPKGVELSARSSSFLFLPLSFVVVNYMSRLDWWHMARLPDRPPQDVGPQPGRRGVLVHVAWVALASTVFLGGYVLGGGPSWGRLPGPFMPAADSRSMDAENLAAVEWAAENLAPGSRITADRVSAVLLAARAGVFPVSVGVQGVKTPELYVPYRFGQEETDIAAALLIRYVYVDMRLADSLPPFGHYFYSDEVGAGQQLTKAQLSKFDRVPAIKLVYRHGPISIYDLKGLGLPEFRDGWTGTTPTVPRTAQVAVGLLVGLLLAGTMRSRLWPPIRAQAAESRLYFGPAARVAVLLAGVGLVSVGLLLGHVWLTGVTVLCAIAVVVAAQPFRVAALVRRIAARVTRRGVAGTVMFLIPLGILIGVSIHDAAQSDIVRVRQILADPTAVHVTPIRP